jgi:hypothetical protein
MIGRHEVSVEHHHVRVVRVGRSHDHSDPVETIDLGKDFWVCANLDGVAFFGFHYAPPPPLPRWDTRAADLRTRLALRSVAITFVDVGDVMSSLVSSALGNQAYGSTVTLASRTVRFAQRSSAPSLHSEASSG